MAIVDPDRRVEESDRERRVRLAPETRGEVPALGLLAVADPEDTRDLAAGAPDRKRPNGIRVEAVGKWRPVDRCLPARQGIVIAGHDRDRDRSLRQAH